MWPVTVGFTVYESFMSQAGEDTVIMPIPQPNEEQQGGHEVLCLGYDMMKQLALRWGDGWGQRGYFWMPFRVIQSADTNLWMVHTGGPWK